MLPRTKQPSDGLTAATPVSPLLHQHPTHVPGRDALPDLLVDGDHDGHEVGVRGQPGVVVGPQVVLQVLRELQQHHAAYGETVYSVQAGQPLGTHGLSAVAMAGCRADKPDRTESEPPEPILQAFTAGIARCHLELRS